jgi:hypothetical protein
MSDQADIQKMRPFHKNRAVNLHLIMKNRPERQISFLVVWLTMFSCLIGWGQKTHPLVIKKDFSHLSLPGTMALKMSKNTDYSEGLDLGRGVIFAWTLSSGKPFTVPANIYYTQSGVMCKMEWELEKATHLPLRFRLGSLADCNALEGKR